MSAVINLISPHPLTEGEETSLRRYVINCMWSGYNDVYHADGRFLYKRLSISDLSQIKVLIQEVRASSIHAPYPQNEITRSRGWFNQPDGMWWYWDGDKLVYHYAGIGYAGDSLGGGHKYTALCPGSDLFIFDPHQWPRGGYELGDKHDTTNPGPRIQLLHIVKDTTAPASP